MPFTPEQLAKIRQKEASLPDALRRDPLVCYTEGYFFITLNTRGEAPILSTVVGHVGAEGPDAPHCEYTDLGRKVKEAWDRNPTVYDGVENIDCEVMPEHFHGLLRLKPGNQLHLGRIVWGFMAGCSHGYWEILGIDWRSMTYTKGARAPEWQDRDHTRSYRGPALFVRGYNDVEPITPEEVQIKIAYIRDQAKKRLIQGNRHACFRITRHAHSRNWTAEVVLRAIAADRLFARDPQRLLTAQQAMLARLNADTPTPTSASTPISAPAPTSTSTPASTSAPASTSTSTLISAQPSDTCRSRGVEGQSIGLDYLGDRALMAATDKRPLVCHRADADRFEEQKAAVMAAARQGTVIVSAFISPKERDIRTQLMVEQLPFIEVMDNGFSERYKPSGKAFYACGEKRLVQITPWNYVYRKEGVQVSREMCMVMNELARVISGHPDDWWKG